MNNQTIKKDFRRVWILTLVLALGVFGSVLAQTGTAHAATPPVLGLVDFAMLVNQHPDTIKGNQIYKMESEQAKKEFETKSPGLSDKDKKELDQALGQRLEVRRQELLKPIIAMVNAEIKAVSDSRGLQMVVLKSSVVYGGVDITDEVLKKITGK